MRERSLLSVERSSTAPTDLEVPGALFAALGARPFAVGVAALAPTSLVLAHDSARLPLALRIIQPNHGASLPLGELSQQPAEAGVQDSCRNALLPQLVEEHFGF